MYNRTFVGIIDLYSIGLLTCNHSFFYPITANVVDAFYVYFLDQPNVPTVSITSTDLNTPTVIPLLIPLLNVIDCILYYVCDQV